MWLTAPNRIGIAAWQVGDSVWNVRATAGSDGARLTIGDQALGLFASCDRPLPVLDEQFVRGNELHLSFPQGSDKDQFGFRLVVRPVMIEDFVSDSQRLAIELLISVETTLLDSHPTLDLIVPSSGASDALPSGAIKNAVHLASGPQSNAAVVLGAGDAPFTSRVDQAGALRLRLFGEFLEKGVIRRARPWVILDRSGEAISEDFAQAAAQSLAASPLPLN